MSRCRWLCGYQGTEQDVEEHETYMLAIDDSEHQEQNLYPQGLQPGQTLEGATSDD